MTDFTDGQGGTVHFLGVNTQQISGSEVSYFYELIFNNASNATASFELSGNISITNNASFTNGIVKNDDFGGLMVFEANATHDGVYDGSHVDGHVQKIGDNSFDFPIGDSQIFRYAAISAPENNADTFTAKYFFENPVGQTIDGETPTASVVGSITLLNTAEFWTITSDGSNSSIMLTLSYHDVTTPVAITANPQEAIHIVRWDESQQLWIDEGGIVDTVNKTVTTRALVEDYGIFTLARIDNEDINDVIVFNGITPNGDGKNDYLIIDGIQLLENNRVEVYNRWGIQVFATDNYDTNGNVFDGYSDGRLTIDGNSLLPTGTYFYVLSFDDSNSKRVSKTGYLYITTN